MMKLEDVKPSTMEGLKRLANKLKKQDGVQHAAALDKAAKQAGFQNFSHANKMLRKE